MFRKLNIIAIVTLLTITVLPAHAFSLSSLISDTTSEKNVSNPLTSLLTKELGINSKQAAGGAGALLAMATQSLGGEQSSELTKMIPGLESLTNAIPDGLGGMLKNMDAVNKVFTLLGIDPAMAQKIAPVLLKYLTEQGASQSLLGELSSLWK